MKYAGVIVDISHEKLDKTFQYIIPDRLSDIIDIGDKVSIPFGRTTRTGYVVELSDIPELEPDKLREIIDVVKGSLSIDEKLIKLAYWMKTNYGSTINQALKTVIPVKEKVKKDTKKIVKLLISTMEAQSFSEQARHSNKTAQARIVEALIDNPITEYALLIQKLNVSASSLKSLEGQGIIDIQETTKERNELNVHNNRNTDIHLNVEQKKAADDIICDYDSGDMSTCLIKGVTGSGKTEVYMEIISHVLSDNRDVIVLIPEISLTYQTVMRFYNRFGDKVSIINSRLSKGERFDRFELARKGKVRIMIGPRSALFTPFSNLGLIIIDEEHENAYKSENVPKYHARETAIELARMNNAKVILGSATPSLEAYYKALHGEYKLYRLDNRAGSSTLPTVEVVDLRDEMRNGNRSIFSDRLAELIEDRLSKHEQVMLFLNRRGYQGFINCRDCGNVIQCPHCAVSLTQHKNNKLVCHYCGYEIPFIKTCPKCGSVHIGTFKAGTQKVEEETHKYFKDAVTLRMDLDTTKGKTGHEQILEKFANHEADILIGTQMIVKGHDFADVTLVGILNADMSLHSSDYTAAERTFELLTQASGRAGRGSRKGQVVIQTYDPDNYSIIHAASQDYEGFYEEEINYRDIMDYPPVSHMMSVRIASSDEEKAADVSELLKKITDTRTDEYMRIIGPANASIYKIKDVFYRIIYYKHPQYKQLTHIKDIIENYYRNNEESLKDCQIQFDFR